MFDLMPFGYERSLLDSFDNFEKEFFKGMNRSLASFRTDIQDKGDHYVLEAELPGFAKEDIHIDLDDNYLTIRAEHKEEKENKDEKKAFVRQERYYGAYERRFDVSGIDVDAIKAGYENGVLTLELPKAPEIKPEVHSIREPRSNASHLLSMGFCCQIETGRIKGCGGATA